MEEFGKEQDRGIEGENGEMIFSPDLAEQLDREIEAIITGAREEAARNEEKNKFDVFSRRLNRTARKKLEFEERLQSLPKQRTCIRCDIDFENTKSLEVCVCHIAQ